jgi:hypothetical protein
MATPPEDHSAPQPAADALKQRMEAGLAPAVPKIYFNGFLNGTSAGDVVAVLERNGQPVAVLNMAFTVAKSFAQAIGSTVSDIEEKSGRSILTTKEIEELSKQGRKQ